MMAADSLHFAAPLIVPSGMSFYCSSPCHRTCSAGAFAPHFALPSAQPSNVQASCLEHGWPAAIAVFAGALAAEGERQRDVVRHLDLDAVVRARTRGAPATIALPLAIVAAFLFAFVAGWEYAGAADKAPILNKEPLVYEEVKMSTRSYK